MLLIALIVYLMGSTMKNKIAILTVLLLAGCANQCPQITPTVQPITKTLDEPVKPVLNHVVVKFDGSHYNLDKKNIGLMYDNMNDLINYSLQEKYQIDYYKKAIEDKNLK